MKTIEECIEQWKKCKSTKDQESVQKELEELFGTLGIDNGVMHFYKYNARVTVSETGTWIESY